MTKHALGVSIVTWNSIGTIAACLTSLRESAAILDLETILIDNASNDGTADLVARDFPWVTLIRSPENAGFARANNRAIAALSADRILLLNPDVILQDHSTLSNMLAFLNEHPNIAAAAPRLTFADGSHQVGDAGYRPSTMNMICHGLGIAHLLRGVRTLYLVRPDRYGGKPVDVDWLCGACLLLLRGAIDNAGPLDESFFLYAEDVEWGCRMRGHGLVLAYLADERATHLQGRSEAQVRDAGAPVSTRWLTSLFDLYSRHNGHRFLRPVRLAFAIGFFGRAAVYGALGWMRPSRRVHYASRFAALVAYARVCRK